MALAGTSSVVLKHIPEAEQTLYTSAENAKDVILLDENDGSMDEAARAKAIAKIHAQDLKKKENLKALVEKELAKEEARKAKEAKKNQMKAEKGKGKKQRRMLLPTQTTLRWWTRPRATVLQRRWAISEDLL